MYSQIPFRIHTYNIHMYDKFVQRKIYHLFSLNIILDASLPQCPIRQSEVFVKKKFDFQFLSGKIKPYISKPFSVWRKVSNQYKQYYNKVIGAMLHGNACLIFFHSIFDICFQAFHKSYCIKSRKFKNLYDRLNNSKLSVLIS